MSTRHPFRPQRQARRLPVQSPRLLLALPCALLTLAAEPGFASGAATSAPRASGADPAVPLAGRAPTAAASTQVLQGGGGDLGALVVRSGQRLVISTDPEVPTVFGRDLIDGPVDAQGRPTTDPAFIRAYFVRLAPARSAAGGLVPKSSPAPQVVSSGVFQFSSLVIEAGAVLDVVGKQPLRLLVSGSAEIAGTLLVDGEDAQGHSGDLGFGGAGARSAPGSGRGGDGGDRPDQTGTQLAQGQPGGGFPGFFGFLHAPGAVVDPDGQPAQGRGGAVPLPGSDFGAAEGGVRWPSVFPGPTTQGLGGFVPNNICVSSQVGTPGAGGSYCFPGTSGSYAVPTPVVGTPPAPPAALPGAQLLKASTANINPDQGGRLLGGAGGGGGGTGIAGTKTNGAAFNCQVPLPPFTLQLVEYFDASGAGGGSGGGALQLRVSERLVISGLIDVSGGRGGDGIEASSTSPFGFRTAAPGGGGSGGALLVQAGRLELTPGVPHFDLAGGQGGRNVWIAGLRGGQGGPGILQIETGAGQSLDPALVLPTVVTSSGSPLIGLQSSDYLRISSGFVPPSPGS